MESEKLERARKRAAAESGFYRHLITYVAVITFLFFVNFFSSPGRWWFFWPALGWGIGLFFHGVKAMGYHGVFGPDWEEKRVKQLLDDDKST